MSFSSDVKDELSRQLSAPMHCKIAELAAIISFCGRMRCLEDGRIVLKIHTENLAVARKYFTLLRKTFNISSDMTIRRNMKQRKSWTYILAVNDDLMARKVLSAVKSINHEGELTGDGSVVSSVIMQNNCCKRAFLRGSFLAGGSMSDPSKTYHFEIVCMNEEKARQIQSIMNVFELEAKIIMRKKYFVVYIKEGTQIVDMLNIMEAHVSLMELENIRILKEMRNSINRRVNCETANINKTVSAAVKQVEDIQYIKNTVGFRDLSDGLVEIANLRLEYPDASLVELGRMLSTPVGKSGVNHRLKKLSDRACELRKRHSNLDE